MAALAPVRIAREGDKKCVDTRSSKNQGNLVAPAVRNEKKLRCCRSSRTCSPHDKLTSERVKTITHRIKTRMSSAAFTLVNKMMPQGLKRTLSSHSRFRAGGALRHLMALAILVFALSTPVNARKRTDYTPNNWGRAGWFILGALALGIVVAGFWFSGASADAWAGASGIFKVSMILMGAFSIAACGAQINRHRIMRNDVANEHTQEQLKATYKKHQSFTQYIVLCMAIVAIVILAFGFTSDNGDLLFGKSMVMFTFLTTLTVIAFFIKQTHHGYEEDGENNTPTTFISRHFNKCSNGDTSKKNFLLGSKTFYLSILVLVGLAILGAMYATGGGLDFEGQSCYFGIAMFVSGFMFLICAATVGCMRYNKFKHVKTMEDWKDEKLNRINKDVGRIVMLVFLGLAVIGAIVMGVVAMSNGVLGESNGMVVFSIFSVLVCAGWGLYDTALAKYRYHNNNEKDAVQKIELRKRLVNEYRNRRGAEFDSNDAESNARFDAFCKDFLVKEKKAEADRQNADGAGSDGTKFGAFQKRRLATVEGRLGNILV